MSKTWTVYILRCADQTFYTGITIDLERRLLEHNSGAKGAKYTRPRRPLRVVYCKKYRSRAGAAREESRIKALTRRQKLELIEETSE